MDLKNRIIINVLEILGAALIVYGLWVLFNALF